MRLPIREGFLSQKGFAPTPPSPLAPPGEGELKRTADFVTAQK